MVPGWFRLLCVAGGIALGAGAADWLREALGETNYVLNLVYLMVLGALITYLVAPLLHRLVNPVVGGLVGFLSRLPPQVIVAGTAGLIVALTLSILLTAVLGNVPGFEWYWSVGITTVLSIASLTFFVRNRDLMFPTRSAAPSVFRGLGPIQAPKILDTSVIIDGRIADLIETGFLDGPLIVPGFVVQEMQRLADHSGDGQKRVRGRRGLEVLERLTSEGLVRVIISERDGDLGPDSTDERLVETARQSGARLLTTDFALNKVAGAQGVAVLNINELANALKSIFLPGEEISVTVIREGREPGQGVAYLPDGTMVVVEEGAGHVGRTVQAVVSSNLQTAMGRMIFARVGASRDVRKTGNR